MVRWLRPAACATGGIMESHTGRLRTRARRKRRRNSLTSASGERGARCSREDSFHFVARVSNHFGEGGGVGEAGIKLYLGLAGGQVDGGQLHPGDGRQGPVHPGDAGGAVHAPHGEGDFFIRGGNGLDLLGCRSSTDGPEVTYLYR